MSRQFHEFQRNTINSHSKKERNNLLRARTMPRLSQYRFNTRLHGQQERINAVLYRPVTEKAAKDRSRFAKLRANQRLMPRVVPLPTYNLRVYK